MKFPVIILKGRSLDLIATENKLRRCTKAALKDGWYKNLEILDGDGVLHTVKEARYARDTGQRLFRGLLAPKLIEVELEMADERGLSLNEVRERVSRALRVDPDFWESADIDISEVLRGIDEAQSIERIWQIITPLVDWPPGTATSPGL
jgi:hypothetical protein